MRTQDIDKVFKDHSFNAQLLLKELHLRKIKLTAYDGTFVVSAKYKDHEEKLYDIYTNLLSYTAGILIDDKYFCKKYLQEKSVPVNSGEVFGNNEIERAISYAEIIKFPVVFKPTMSSHGDNVVMDIENKTELESVIHDFISKYQGTVFYLIEEQFEGNEYRLFITSKGFFAAVGRTPANITGDGENSIKDLINRENYRRMNPRNTCLCEIPMDKVSENFLRKQGLSFNSVVPKNTKIFLRKNSNVSTGGNCYDVTNKVSDRYKKIAEDLLTTLNVPFLGIDLLCSDISKFGKYVICELNSSPGLSLHMMPEKGEAHDVASALADIIFPKQAMLNIYDIDLPKSAKYIVSKLLKKGGECFEIKNTSMYVVKFRGIEFLFKDDFNPAIPYMYGVIFSNKYYWSKMLNQIGLVYDAEYKKNKISIMVTDNHSYNAILHKEVKLRGDGKSSLRDLIKIENMKRINTKSETVFPIKTNLSETKLKKIIPKNKSVVVIGSTDCEDISESISGFYKKIAYKLIDFFPRLPYLCFELYTINFSKKGNYSIGNILLSGDVNVFFDLKGDNKTNKNAAEFIIETILKSGGFDPPQLAKL